VVLLIGFGVGNKSSMIERAQYTVGGFWNGVIQSWPIGISVFAYGLVFGAISRQAGLGILGASSMSAFVFAGASQLVVMDIWGNSTSALPVILTAFAVNLRLILMGAALRPYFSGLSRFVSYGTLFFMNDESWALAMQRFSKGMRDAAFLLGSGLVVYVSWLSSTIIGQCLVSRIKNPADWGLDFAFTAVFLTLLIGMRRGKSDVVPWLVAAAVSIVVHHLLPGKWYILIGAITGSGAYAVFNIGGKR
jgi:4-azaleucine resistance transporter AzlC